MRALPLIALTLLLAACDQPTGTPEAGGDAAASAEPATSGNAPANVIPARFHGVWDAETGSCDPASDLRMEIAADTITFYESEGTVRGVTGAQAGPTKVELAMEGEGETWGMAMSLDVSGTGANERLTTRHEDSQDEPLTRKRCPA
ncbi:MAG TPA: hypothetical protein VK913_09455 [Erythrobacter sp.]|nr:hypothetical protein [Erythrobacter sp.]